MTVDCASKQQPLGHREQRIYNKLEKFAELYACLDTKGKKTAVPAFLKQCSKADKWPHLDQKIAAIYLKLELRDQRACLSASMPEVKKRAAALLHFEPPHCFYPLFSLAEQCQLMKDSKRMSPLYRDITTSLRTTAADKIAAACAFNQLIERNLLPVKPIDTDLPLIALPFERTALAIRQGICTVQSNYFFFAGTTTHQRVQADGETILTDPYADDGAALEIPLKNQLQRLVSITDGGGKGKAVVKTAKRVNNLFISCLAAHAHLLENPEKAQELLLQATFFTQNALRKEKKIQHATHAGLLAVIPENKSPFGAVSLLGDTTAYLLLETEEEVNLEKLNVQDHEKQTSHTGGDFSSTGDYSSLTLAAFHVPSTANRACIILGSDGLADNLDPRNALHSALLTQLDTSPGSFYRKRTLNVSNRTLSMSNILQNAHDQKDPKIFDATHQFPTPWALQMDLGYQPLTPSERLLLDTLPVDAAQTWNGINAAPQEHQTALIDLYSKVKIRSLYNPSSPESFATALAAEARSNGKADDILAAVCWLKV